MATILTIGDPHFKQRGSLRYAKMSEDIIVHANNIKPNAIVILGDTLHTHEIAHVTPFNMAYHMINQLRKIAFTIVIVGNHDYRNNNCYLSGDHFFNPLKEWDNVVVIDKVIELTIGKYKFGFCPYVYPGLFMKALSTKFTDKTLNECKAIFAHQEIQGVQMGAIKSEHGDVWGENLPLLISGHIHEFQLLQSNMIYAGTPIQHNFGDGTDKGIYVYTFTDDNYTMKKLQLKVPLKKIFRVTIEELRELSVPENIEAKIIVMATPEQYRAVEKEGIIQYFRDNGVTVIHEDTTIKQLVPEINSNKPFLEILYDKIKHDDCLIGAYKEIFGSKSIGSSTAPRRLVIIKKK